MITHLKKEMDIENRAVITALPEWKHDDTTSKQEPLTQQLLQIFNNESLSTLVNSAHRSNDDFYQTYCRYQRNKLFPKRDRLRKQSEEENTLFNVSWEEQVWSKISNSSDVISRGNLQAVRDSISGRVIQLWIKLNLRQSIIAVKIKQIISYGNARLLSSNFKSMASYGVEYDKEIIKEKNNLAILDCQQQVDKRLMNDLTDDQLHLYFMSDDDLSATLSTLKLTGLSASLILARPDIQNAYTDIKNVDSKAAVPLEALVPTFELEYAISRGYYNFDEIISGSKSMLLLNLLTRCLLSPDNVHNNYQPGYNVEAAEKYYAFRKVLLKALKEVKDCIIQERSLLARQQYVEKVNVQLDSNFGNKTLGIENNKENIRYMLGAEQEALHYQFQSLEIILARLTNRVELSMCLGKGV